jgi:hypothetical protein
MKPVWRAAIVAIGVAAGWMLGHASRVEFSPPAVDRSNLVADRAASAPAPQPDGPLLPTQAGLPPRESSAPLIRTARRATEGIVSAVPAPLRDHLLREGYRVREQTALTSIALEDGTRVAVPVAQVRLQFIGDTVY